MDIEKLRKEMTREEFLKYERENNEQCPSDFGLKDIYCSEKDCIFNFECEKCWEKSVENIKFKDDMEDKKLNKELNIIEASSMPLGTEFKVIFKDGSKCSHIVSFGNCKFYQDKNVDDSIHVLFINATFIPIQQPVSFMEALKSGKRVRVDIDDLIFTDIKYKFNTYQRMEELIELMGIELTFTGKKNVILNGRWYVEND